MALIPLQVSQGQAKVLGSEFDCEFGPLSAEGDFKAIYEAFKKAYPRADHYPYGYVIGSYSKSSDDGEPGGSAGVPLSSYLKDKGVDGYFIVARYFGGTKLGIPRLRRSFLEAAENAFKASRLGQEVDVHCYRLEVEYGAYETLNHFSKRYNYRLENTEFALKVKTNVLSSATLTEVFARIGIPSDAILEESTLTAIEEVQQ